jgi:hypothetical protein
MQNFNFKPILFFSLFLISLGFLCYAVIKSERKKNKEYIQNNVAKEVTIDKS